MDVEKVLGGERQWNAQLKSILEGFGCNTDIFEMAPKRTNLAGAFKGTGGGRSLILNGHIDTVPFGRIEHWKKW